MGLLWIMWEKDPGQLGASIFDQFSDCLNPGEDHQVTVVDQITDMALRRIDRDCYHMDTERYLMVRDTSFCG